METTEPDITARVILTEDGETFHEYQVGGVTYGSLSALQHALSEA